MKKLIGLFLLAGGVALAVVVGQRMSTDAMAVVIGVAVGVAASVPTSLLLIALLRRGQGDGFRDERRAPPDFYQPPQQQPNIILLDPSRLGLPQGPGQFQMPLPPPDYGAAEAGQRRIQIVGQDQDW
jgi:hypothetical protein